MSGGSSQSYDSPGGASSGSPGGASSSPGGERASSSSRARGGINTPARSKRKRTGADDSRPQSTPHDKTATEEPVLEDDEKTLRSTGRLRHSSRSPTTSGKILASKSSISSSSPTRRATGLGNYTSTHWNVRAASEGGGPGPEPGLLLRGEPGTGKTALAQALAVEADASFLPIGSSKVLSQWAGKADRTVAAIFAVAKQRAPCIVFFDEADKLLQSTASESAEAC